jgi:hypothetical protein
MVCSFGQTVLSLNLAVTLVSCVTLGKLHNLPGIGFLIYEMKVRVLNSEGYIEKYRSCL